jgi:hypothetical protein
MKDLLDAYYLDVGRFRGMGLSESESHSKAEEAAMAPTERSMQNILTEALETYAEEAGTEIKTRTFEDAGLLTRDTGLVVEVNGSTFHLTIVKA